MMHGILYTCQDTNNSIEGSMMHVIVYTCQDTNNHIEGSLWCMLSCTLVRTLTTILKALYEACDLVHLSGH